ncbi:unnamed protein product [Cylindrotheca closterium]|uniref:Uncharacterized protein n=1 Tax=Cylindrotheca closterium TaxID=2856 RepID=A0AAD2CV42_9STRA|nr:unnamed protein product [Cylindrotheca closterium]
MSSNQPLHRRSSDPRKGKEMDDLNPGRNKNLLQAPSSSEAVLIPFQSVSNTTRPKNPSRDPHKASMAKRIGNLFSTKPPKGRDHHGETSSLAVQYDNATIQSADGQQSVEAVSVAPTLHSQATQKASNRPEKIKEEEKSKKPTKHWKKFKKLVGVKSTKTEKLEPIAVSTEQRNAKLDVAILGRMDGIDPLSLGPANLSSFPINSDDGAIRFSNKNMGENKTTEGAAPPSIDFDPLKLSFTTLSKSWNPSDIVSDSIWSAGGMEQPELVLEGFANERWTLRFNETPSTPTSSSTGSSSFVPRLQPIDDDDESSTLTDNEFPLRGLWNQLWGNKPPSPTLASPSSPGGPEANAHEELLEIAAACSVPVDLDEGTFIIDSPDHLRSVHEMVTIPLQAQRFDSALLVFENLLKGLDQGQNSNLQHLVGATHHNIGLVHLCIGNFGDALLSFQKAVEARIDFFASHHPLVAVSLVRQGEAQFALGVFADALESMKRALAMSPIEDCTRAKILNNLGVVHYQLDNYEESLDAFIAALEIQRRMLGSPIRRQHIVHDASLTMCNMGKLYIKQALFRMSYTVFEEAFVLQTTAYPKDHDIVLSTLKSMALVLAKNSQFAESLPIFRNMLRHQEERFGSDSEHYTETMGMIGCLLAKDLEFDESASCLKQVIEWQTKHLTDANPKTKMTKEALATVEDIAQGKVSIWV